MRFFQTSYSPNKYDGQYGTYVLAPDRAGASELIKARRMGEWLHDGIGFELHTPSRDDIVYTDMLTRAEDIFKHPKWWEIDLIGLIHQACFLSQFAFRAHPGKVGRITQITVGDTGVIHELVHLKAGIDDKGFGNIPEVAKAYVKMVLPKYRELEDLTIGFFLADWKTGCIDGIPVE